MTPAVERWKHLTERELPRKAASEKWAIRLDHCFKRITLDHVFKDVWYRHLRKPAQTNLSEEQAGRAVAIAEQILEGGPPILEALNRRSLQWRGKAKND